ncbi:unnamed protein product [Cylicocyclus nassatus]|uniref:ethanolamine-phosphate cytidylyltransferase n=1 Tax=Cylicocyclus nassatus TaxID=53992 RepID=A0AA36HH48_CYLNA|nr:unnamed protein product [Cylicocyclus nassatus]
MTEEETKNIWVDGSFDMVHFGDVYKLRSAKAHGAKLIVGVHSDKEIFRNTGKYPIFKENDRYRLISALKCVDQVIKNAPYRTTADILDKHLCKYCVVEESEMDEDRIADVRRNDRCLVTKQAFNISYEDIVERVLRSQKAVENGECITKPWGTTPFLATSETFKMFSAGSQPKEGDKIVYVCGTFDIFNVGHLSFLEKAKNLGDYLIVGIYSDEEIIQTEGYHPIMSLYERALCTFAYKPVDEIILGAPKVLIKDMLDRFKISIVARGLSTSSSDRERFAEAKKKGILRVINSHSNVTTNRVVDRILRNRSSKEREQAEVEYINLFRNGVDSSFSQYPVQQQG